MGPQFLRQVRCSPSERIFIFLPIVAKHTDFPETSIGKSQPDPDMESHSSLALPGSQGGIPLESCKPPASYSMIRQRIERNGMTHQVERQIERRQSRGPLPPPQWVPHPPTPRPSDSNAKLTQIGTATGGMAHARTGTIQSWVNPA